MERRLEASHDGQRGKQVKGFFAFFSPRCVLPVDSHFINYPQRLMALCTLVVLGMQQTNICMLKAFSLKANIVVLFAGPGAVRW